MFIGSEGVCIFSAVRLGSRWLSLCQRYCVNACVRGHTFTNNMNIFLDNTQLLRIQWIYLINPIISFEWGFLCSLVASSLTETGVFVPGCQAASLRGWSPSQGDCYDHVVFVPTSGCSGEIGSVVGGEKKWKEMQKNNLKLLTCKKIKKYRYQYSAWREWWATTPPSTWSEKLQWSQDWH